MRGNAFCTRASASGSGSTTELTCPRAWTPVSVRPAPGGSPRKGTKRSRAFTSSPCTVRSPPGCTCQPWKCVPS